MEVSCQNINSMTENEALQEDTYSGKAAFLYSSKVNGVINIASACEILAESEAFSFALNNHGRIYFRDNDKLRTQLLSIDTSITGLGMTVSGHNDFITTNSGASNIYSFYNALDLLLSDKKLFNTALGFPTESARIFMRPIAIRSEGNEHYEVFIPCFRLYAGGIISLSLSAVSGFKDATVRNVVNEVNKSQRNINSVLCEKALYSACIEYQISQMSLKDRIAQKKAYKIMIKSALSTSEELEFLDEILTVHELVHTDKITLPDIARNLLSVVARAINLGAVKTKVNWSHKQYHGSSVGEFWIGKPIIYIQSHSRQKSSSTENWAIHKHLVNSVMARSYLANTASYASLALTDIRSFNDFNHFYSESASLLLSSTQVGTSIEQSDSYTFDNLISDTQVLNEGAHFIRVYYLYASLGIDRCKTAINVARLELKLLEFEQSYLFAYKYGEIANYFNEVKRGEQLSTTCKLLHKKIETVRKALELDEKVSSESFARRITIIFGVIASAALSPELIQPLAKFYGISFANNQVEKLVGIGTSVVLVITLLTLLHYIPQSFRWLTRSKL